MLDYILLKPAKRYLQRIQADDQIRIINALDTLLKKARSSRNVKICLSRVKDCFKIGGDRSNGEEIPKTYVVGCQK